MPKTKGATSVEKAQEARYRLIIRNKDFLKELEKLYKVLRKRGTLTEEQRERIAERWGMPSIPWETIINFDNFCSNADRISYFEWVVLSKGPGAFGVSYPPLAVHRVENDRFVFLRADLEHPVDDLAELFKHALHRLRAGRPRPRKRLDKLDDYLRCWDLANQEITLGKIAQNIYLHEWCELLVTLEDQLPEPTPKEIEQRAKELRQKGHCAYNWSFKQAREDLKEEALKKSTEQRMTNQRKSRSAVRIRHTLRQRVWRNIQTAYKLIGAVTPKPHPKV